ncbi:hypothetical protein JL107_03670 [Nakamurella flavida]|uniref:Carbohydrate kinase n=1 Tax=Nakamurella flavida TaxID=363630 RepID=A0A938YGL4_9ACTN|nr:FGGY family carbohydrate kinase [Nakamurella flavida]MBM9475537.1 hypothetical protein [Nakamurella flavida]MDP9778188.1 sugar (pentulose or hexulose) kinase [Nakamurella flavida]
MLPTVTIDIGTTSVKLCLFDAEGRSVASARHSTPTTGDRWGEIYDVEALHAMVLGFVRGVPTSVRESVRRVSIAGVGESGGLVRPDATLASPMILWHDHRGADLLAVLTDDQRATISAITGLPVNANYGLSKAAWALAHAGDAGRDARWLNIAEYLAARMTGRRWSERSLASRTMALDVSTGTWSAEVCALLGVDVGLFPEVRSAAEGTVVTAAWAGEAALGPDVVVHVAGHDHMVGAIGADLRRGELLNSTGTTEGLLFLRDHPDLSAAARRSKLANGLACRGSDFTLFASIPTGGSAFATVGSMLGMDTGSLLGCLQELHTRWLADDVDLAAVPLVLPQFRGSPPPDKSAVARGVMAGIGSDTAVEDVVLGCFLGLVRQFQDVLTLFRVPVERVKVIGPAARNDLWLQLKADLLGIPLSVAAVPEVVSRGAQALASGTVLDWAGCSPREIAPDGGRTDRLREWSATSSARWEHMKAMPA